MDNEPLSPHPGLTPRLNETLSLVVAGRSNAEIAAALHLTTGTVEQYLLRIRDRLDIEPSHARDASSTRTLIVSQAWQTHYARRQAQTQERTRERIARMRNEWLAKVSYLLALSEEQLVALCEPLPSD